MLLSPVSFITLWLISFALYALFYSIWTYIVIKDIYKENLSTIINLIDNKFAPSLSALITFWAVISWGSIVFVIPRIDPDNFILMSILWGGMWGFVTQTIYDILNVSFLKEWTILVTILNIMFALIVGAVNCLILSSIYIQIFM